MDEMNRREFTKTIAAGTFATLAGARLSPQSDAASKPGKKPAKSCILVWLDGAPSTLDMWDLKPRGNSASGPFKQIETAGEMKICEHLPRIAKVMDRLSIVRSMSTREASHDRGAYYLQTGNTPQPNIVHPTAGSVISHALKKSRNSEYVPGYVSIDGPKESGGYLGQQFAPLVVQSEAQPANFDSSRDSPTNNPDAAELLKLLNDDFGADRNQRLKQFSLARDAARSFYSCDFDDIMNLDNEDADTHAAYGDDRFGRATLLARRFVERGVSFVRVNFPKSWDVRSDFFNTMRLDLLPTLDRGIAALVNDLTRRKLLDQVVLLVMGSCGRSPRIRHNRREPWARSWSLLIGGGGLKSGIAVGETDDSGARLLTRSYSAPHLWATVLKALDIPLDTLHKDRVGRPRKILGGGFPIRDLIA